MKEHSSIMIKSKVSVFALTVFVTFIRFSNSAHEPSNWVGIGKNECIVTVPGTSYLEKSTDLADDERLCFRLAARE
jgi:hypothetical protein